MSDYCSGETRFSSQIRILRRKAILSPPYHSNRSANGKQGFLFVCIALLWFSTSIYYFLLHAKPRLTNFRKSIVSSFVYSHSMMGCVGGGFDNVNHLDPFYLQQIFVPCSGSFSLPLTARLSDLDTFFILLLQ